MKRKLILTFLWLFLLIGCRKQDPTDNEIVVPKIKKITASGYEVSVYANELTNLRNSGPFIRLKDGSLFTIMSGTSRCSISRDEGKSWTDYTILDAQLFSFASPVILLSKNGTLFLGFSNGKERIDLAWNNSTHDYTNGALPVYAARSLDGGKTWQDLQKLHDDWTGMNRDIKELNDGKVIFTSQMMRHNPGRNVVITYMTNDNGKTWTRSNVIDMGGSGTHGGVMESTLEQLKNGQLWMLLRTNQGFFWETHSDDKGLTWDKAEATTIDASTSPGALIRLASGRLALVWNRKYQEELNNIPLLGGDGNFTEVPASWQRDELSLILSADEGKNWTKPAVIAKNYPYMYYIAGNEMKRMLAYPYIFEAQPGKLWITTGFGSLKIELQERNYLEN
jgi:Neuraminidase (sialidase)